MNTLPTSESTQKKRPLIVRSGNVSSTEQSSIKGHATEDKEVAVVATGNIQK